MDANPNASTRIPIEVNRAVTGTVFGIAISAYLFRCYVQLFVHKHWPAEDWVLLFTVIVLVAATIICFIQLELLYNALDLVLHGFGSSLFGETLESIPKESKLANSLSTLWWFILFPVKLAYLLFFRKLIARLKHLNRYWCFVTGFLLPAIIICEVVSWQTCPYTDTFKLIARCSGPEASARTVKITATTTVFDILSDVFVASIPICLLWRVRISTRQKVGLGMTLCLSLVMAILALVRISGIRLPGGEVDIVWVSFWEQIECNVAMWLVSMTAFRSFFVSRAQDDSEGRRHPHLPNTIGSLRESIRRRLSHIFHRRSSRQPHDSGHGEVGSYGRSLESDQSGPMMIASKDPAIPSATMTGMRTAIDDVGKTRAFSPVVSSV